MSANPWPTAGRNLLSMRYEYDKLLTFAETLGQKVGLGRDAANAQAKVLIEADLMGHSTYGLNLLPGFLKDIESGALNASAEPKVLSDKGSAVVWDGCNQLGTLLVTAAINEGGKRIKSHPVVTYVIKRSGHIGALGAYLRQATDAGLRHSF